LVFSLWILAIEFINKKHDKIQFIIVGASLASVLGYFLNRGEFIGSFSQAPAFILSGIGGSVLLIPSIWHRNLKIRKFSLTWATLYSLFIVSILLFFRLYNVFMRDIPNEERSLMIAGIEIHHIISGLFILSFSTILILNFPSKSRVVLIFYCLGLAMIGDQITYFLMYPLTDAAFFTPFSLIGAIFATCWLILKIFLSAVKGKHIDE
jgi:hypothetical protein